MTEVTIKELLTKTIKAGASDLHIVVGAPPIIRLHGNLEALPGYPRLKPEDTQEIIYSVMNEEQIAEFESEKECDLSFGISGLSRFRLNVYRDRGSVVGAFRAIPFEIMAFEDLGLPRVVADFAFRPLGLVLVCGPTGSGKSTTLASILDRMAQEEFFHIFNVLQQEGRQIIIASDKAPDRLGLLEQRLVSRFAGGIVVNVRPPEWEARVAILEHHAATLGTPVPQEVLALIATRVPNDVRKMIGALRKLTAHAALIGEPISAETVNELLSHLGAEEAA